MLVIIIVLVLVITFILLREVWCWYWKINLRIKQIEQTNENLEQIKALLIYANSTQNELGNKGKEKLPEL